MTWQSKCTHKTLDSWAPFPGPTSQKDRRPVRSLLVKLPTMLMSAAEEEQKTTVSYTQRVTQLGFGAQVGHAGESLR